MTQAHVQEILSKKVFFFLVKSGSEQERSNKNFPSCLMCSEVLTHLNPNKCV